MNAAAGRWPKLLTGVVLFVLLVLAHPTPGGRVVVPVAPLDPPVIAPVGLQMFDLDTVWAENDFIFRGTVNTITEYEISWMTTDGRWTNPYYCSVCDITVLDVLCGEPQRANAQIKLVTSQSSRSYSDDGYALRAGNTTSSPTPSTMRIVRGMTPTTSCGSTCWETSPWSRASAA